MSISGSSLTGGYIFTPILDKAKKVDEMKLVTEVEVVIDKFSASKKDILQDLTLQEFISSDILFEKYRKYKTILSIEKKYQSQTNSLIKNLLTSIVKLGSNGVRKDSKDKLVIKGKINDRIETIDLLEARLLYNGTVGPEGYTKGNRIKEEVVIKLLEDALNKYLGNSN